MNLTDVEFKDSLTVFQDSVNLPWYISHAFFWVSTVVVLSWPFRIFISLKSVHINCTLEKVFGARYENSSPRRVITPPPCFPLPPPSPGLGERSNVATEFRVEDPSEILPSYSDVMLNERFHHQEEPSASTKYKSVSIQVDPKRTDSRTSFSHIIEDDFMNLVACTHEGDQSHRMPLNNIELNPRYQRNRLYKIKCVSFNDRFLQPDNATSTLDTDGLVERSPHKDGTASTSSVSRIIKKSKSFVSTVQPLTPLCESLVQSSHA